VLILAFDTSGFAGSVALLDGPAVLAERLLDPARRSAQTLAPAVAEVLREQGVQPKQVGLVATTIGPGSFTGLRVGVTTAKTWAYATGGAVIGLSTLAVIAEQVPAELRVTASGVHAVLDAQRKELFVGRFRADGQRLADDAIVPADRWLQDLSSSATSIIVTGSGLSKLLDRMPPGVIAMSPENWEPRAATVGRLAWRDYERGRRDDLWRLAPLYLRPSYAEEKHR
jgi:tRNA threonylcarbamoyladenosine biosynthesis protein TsaB